MSYNQEDKDRHDVYVVSESDYDLNSEFPGVKENKIPWKISWALNWAAKCTERPHMGRVYIVNLENNSIVFDWNYQAGLILLKE